MQYSPSPFPGLHAQLLSLAVQKAEGRPGSIYHVMRATADAAGLSPAFCTVSDKAGRGGLGTRLV